MEISNTTLKKRKSKLKKVKEINTAVEFRKIGMPSENTQVMSVRLRSPTLSAASHSKVSADIQNSFGRVEGSQTPIPKKRKKRKPKTARIINVGEDLKPVAGNCGNGQRINLQSSKPATSESSTERRKNHEILVKDVASVNKSSKKKKKKPKQKLEKSENPTEDLNKVVANVIRPKEVMSSNWQAFLASGFAKTVKIGGPQNYKLSSKFCTGTKNVKYSNKSPQASNAAAKRSFDSMALTNVNPSTEESYITELDPKSDKERHGLTKCLAMDCEMVGVFDGKESVLARVSLVNQHGECVYDQFVKPKEEVSDYRTKVSGIRPSDLKKGKDFEIVQKEVASMLHNRVLVGHALYYDLKVLMLKHPPNMIRDTSRFRPFRNVTNGRTPSLKILASQILGVTIQTGEHSSVEDARATMQLYNLYKKEWENHRLEKKTLRRKKSIAASIGHTSSQDTKKRVKTETYPLLRKYGAYLYEL